MPSPVTATAEPFGDLFSKAEQAWKDLITANLPGTLPSYLKRRTTDESGTEPLPIQLGESDDTMRRPLIICFCDRDQPAGVGGAAMIVTASVQIQTFHHELVATHMARVGWFEDMWQAYDRILFNPSGGAPLTTNSGQGYANLAAALTNHAKQFHCHGLSPEQAKRAIINGTDGDFWSWTREFSMCCQTVNGIA